MFSILYNKVDFISIPVIYYNCIICKNCLSVSSCSGLITCLWLLTIGNTVDWRYMNFECSQSETKITICEQNQGINTHQES